MMAFSDDLGQISPEVGAGMKAGTMAAALAFGPVGAVVGGIVSIITSLLGSGSAAEKAARTKEGIENVKKVTQDIASRGARAYLDYDFFWLGRQLQLARPEEMKAVFAAAGSGVDDSIFNQMGPYLPIIEAMAVLGAMTGSGWTEADPERTIPFDPGSWYSNMMAQMENVRYYLVTKGIDYPNSHEIAANLLAGGSGTTLSSFLTQLKQESFIQQEQSMIEQGIQEALRKLGITGTTQTASLIPDEIFGVPIIYLVGVVGAAYLVSRR